MADVAPTPSSGAIISGDQAAALASKGVGKLARKIGLGKKKSKFVSDMASSTAKYFAPKARGAIKKLAGFKKGGRVKKMNLPPRTKSGRFMKKGGKVRK